MRRWLVALSLALALGGCASVPPVPPGPAEAALPANWLLRGRIGIQAEQQSLSGHFQWQHRGDTDDVLLTSPLGQGVARIVSNAAGVTLEVPNRAPRHAPDAETLTREALGYDLPVAGLAWWVQARPDPERPFEVTRDGAGRIAQLRQDGWVIDYLQYATDAPGRPRKLVVARDGLEIRLVADSWQAE